MMRSVAFVLAFFFICFCVSPPSVLAQRRSGGSGAIANNPIAALIDENNDGVLSAREVRQAGNAIRKLDTDGDGKITEEELELAGGGSSKDDLSDEDDQDEEDRARPSRTQRRNAPARGSRDSSDDSETDLLKKDFEDAINQAAAFYKQGKFSDAGEAVEDAIVAMEDLQDEGQLVTVSGSVKRLVKAHELLVKKGVDLPELPNLGPPKKRGENGRANSAAAGRSSSGNESEEESSAAEPQGISFTKQIAPILVKRCRSCHIDKQEAELSFKSYASLLDGSESGAVIESGDASRSILIDLVQEGEMPPKGSPVPDAEIQLLAEWVDEGAKFDGNDEKASIKRLGK
ncbi:MAG: hypothetical protein GY768_03420 [Planctomycetaceae bacterium]|nr:hypothetical protein [Planctomycetaceae bacterium]